MNHNNRGLMQWINTWINIIQEMRRKYLSIFVIIGCLIGYGVTANAVVEKPFLSSGDAFVFSASLEATNHLQLKWKIAPGYYLYRDKMQINVDPSLPMTINYPKAQWKQNALGEVFQAYAGQVVIPISFVSALSTLHLTVGYQGCSSQGFCYPPVKKYLLLDLQQLKIIDRHLETIATTAMPSLPTLLTDQNSVYALLTAHGLGIQWLIFICLGILLAFTPCVLPMIPILTSIIVGQKKMSDSKVFFLSLCYVLGMALTYACAGLIAAALGSSVQVWLQKPIFIFLTSFLFVLLACALFELYELRLPRHWHLMMTHWSNRHQGGTFIGVFFMGVLSTLIVSPCVTAPLIGILIFISHTGDKLLGASALFAMGLGMGIPLLLIGLSVGHWLPKRGRWMEAIKKCFGIMMLGMALWLLSRIIPQAFVWILGGLLVLGIAVYWRGYLSTIIGWRTFNHMMSVLLIGLAIILLGKGGWLFVAAPSASTISNNLFTTVHTVADIEKQLFMAKMAQRPVLIDFYADWCESCIAMDKKIFNLPEVQQQLRHFMLLRIDLSANSTADELLLKHFKVIAPPTILFFNKNGKELSTKRIIGEMDKQAFLSRIQNFMAVNCDKNKTC